MPNKAVEPIVVSIKSLTRLPNAYIHKHSKIIRSGKSSSEISEGQNGKATLSDKNCNI